MFKSKKTERNPVSVKVDGRRINAKYLNPYTYSFLPTGRFTDRQKVMRSKSCFLILFFFLNLLWKMLIFFGNSKKITLFLIAITTFTGGRFSRIICSEFESEEQEYWEWNSNNCHSNASKHTYQSIIKLCSCICINIEQV